MHDFCAHEDWKEYKRNKKEVSRRRIICNCLCWVGAGSGGRSSSSRGGPSDELVLFLVPSPVSSPFPCCCTGARRSSPISGAISRGVAPLSLDLSHPSPAEGANVGAVEVVPEVPDRPPGEDSDCQLRDPLGFGRCRGAEGHPFHSEKAVRWLSDDGMSCYLSSAFLVLVVGKIPFSSSGHRVEAEHSCYECTHLHQAMDLYLFNHSPGIWWFSFVSGRSMNEICGFWGNRRSTGDWTPVLFYLGDFFIHSFEFGEDVDRFVCFFSRMWEIMGSTQRKFARTTYKIYKCEKDAWIICLVSGLYELCQCKSTEASLFLPYGGLFKALNQLSYPFVAVHLKIMCLWAGNDFWSRTSWWELYFFFLLQRKSYPTLLSVETLCHLFFNSSIIQIGHT